MSELLKELCTMTDFISDLLLTEKEPITKRGILELLIMVSEKIEDAHKYKGPNIDNNYFQSVIQDIKETKDFVTGYKQKTKIYADLLEHVIKVVNEVETLFLGVELTGKLLPINQAIDQVSKIK